MNYKSQTRNQTSLITSGKFWALTFLLILIYSAFIFGQSTIYIDPTNSGDPNQNGSIDHPYDNWSDFSFTNGNTYLQKCGTTYTASTRVGIVDKSNITLGSYSTGPKPIIHRATGVGDIVGIERSHNIIIDGFELKGDLHPEHNNGTWNSFGVGVGGDYSNSEVNHNVQIRNCDIHRCYCGVYGIRYNAAFDVSSDSILVYNCNIYDIDEDGIYLDYSTNPRIIGCHLWDINMQWFKGVTAPGDGIQLTWGCTNWLIQDCIIDRRTTAGKMSVLIAANDRTNPDYSGSFIGNTIYTPKDTVARWPGDQVGGTGLYITDSYNVTVARNKFIGRGYPSGEKGQGIIYIIQSNEIDMYYNLFDSVANGGMFYDISELHFNNNTIVSDQVADPGDGDFLVCISGTDGGEARNNISAGVTGSPALSIIYSPAVVQSNNINISGPSSEWNSVLGIVNWENSDFHLNENSPSRNTGFDYNDFFFDIDSVSVPQENIRDKGAYEYSDGSQSTNNPPIISNQTFSINENAANGSIVGTVIATDPDAGQTLTYSIMSGNTNNAFTINASTGTLSVNNSAALNFEATPSFGLTVRAQDNGQGNLYSQATVTVNLNNVNENPNITNQTFIIDEFSSAGTLVGSVVASDPDEGQLLSFSILSGNIDNAFNLNTETGILTVENPNALDYDVNPAFYLVVEVTDNGNGNLTNQALITVNLNELASDSGLRYNILNYNIYPNPATDFIEISLDNAKNGEVIISIIDLNGGLYWHKLYTLSSDKLKDKIELSNLSKGIYLIKIQQESTQIFQKLIKF